MLGDFHLSLLADPITKQPTTPASFKSVKGVLDGRVFLKNTHGFEEWVDGQDEYENVFKEEVSAEEYCEVAPTHRTV